MRWFRNRRAWPVVAVAVMVMATTASLPASDASAAAGDWIDTGFGAQGVAAAPAGVVGGQFAIDPADRSVVASPVASTVTNLMRLTADGVVDPAFAGGGRSVPGRPGRVHVDAGGTVSLLASTGSLVGAVVWRFTDAGEPDAGFGNGGSVSIVDDSSTVTPIGLLDRPGGGLLVVFGVSAASGAMETRLVALTSSGAPDISWAPGSPEPGVMVVPQNPKAVAADGDAVVLLADTGGATPSGFLLRLTASGAPDAGFGSGGRADLPGNSQFLATALVVDAGAAFVVGTSRTPVGVLALAKVLPNGSLDPTYGTGGIARGMIRPAPNACSSTGFRVAVRAGRGTVIGTRSGCGGALVIDRFTPTGALDPTFGAAGELAFSFTVFPFIVDVQLQSTGRAVFTARIQNRFSLLRILDAEAPPAAGTFVGLTPARILDTRKGIGATIGAIPAGGSLDLQVAGRGGVPSDGAGAVVLNLTVTQPSADGNIVAFPTASAMPLASNVNFVPGQTIPNLTTVKLGDAGQVTLKNNSAGTVQLVADVSGYYRGGPVTLPGTFAPLSPVRILDTRAGTGAPAGSIPPGGSIDLQIAGSGGVPVQGAAAVVMNVTVTQPSSDGNVVAFPTEPNTPAPLASNLNFGAGQTIANLVTVRVGSGGQVTLKNNSSRGSVHLVADLAGYYLAGTALVPGAFVPITPARALDTRPGGTGALGPINAGAVVLVQNFSNLRFPAAVAMNVTVTQPTWDGSIVAYDGTTIPLASNLNFVPGLTIPNLVIVKVDQTGRAFLLNNSTQGTVQLIADVAGYFLS